MPSFVPGKRSRTASAMTWAVEWRIASSSSWAPASSSSSTEPRSGATRSSASSASGASSVRAVAAALGLVALLVLLVRHAITTFCRRNRNDPSSIRQDERPTGISRGSTRLRHAYRWVRRAFALRAALTGGPGPVHRPLTGGAMVGLRSPGFHQPRLARDLRPDRLSRSMRSAGLYRRRPLRTSAAARPSH